MKKAAVTLVLLMALSSSASASNTIDSVHLANTVEDYTEYDFEDDLVLGDLVKPDGELLSVRRRWQRSSLIRIRDHFVDKLIRSAERLL